MNYLHYLLIFSLLFFVNFGSVLGIDPVDQLINENAELSQSDHQETLTETSDAEILDTKEFSNWEEEGRLIKNETASKTVGWILLGLLILGATIYLMKL